MLWKTRELERDTRNKQANMLNSHISQQHTLFFLPSLSLALSLPHINTHTHTYWELKETHMRKNKTEEKRKKKMENIIGNSVTEKNKV